MTRPKTTPEQAAALVLFWTQYGKGRRAALCRTIYGRQAKGAVSE